MKKFFAPILSMVMIVSATVGLVVYNIEKIESQAWSIHKVYAMAQDLGFSGSLEELIAMFKGDKGEKGEKGDKGDKGDDGKDGINGKDGVDGKDGQNGQDGKDGSKITIATNGNWCIDGVDTGVSAVGSSGGENGQDGLTPYIKDGYWWIGLENTFVKAQGQDGKDGKDGKDGVDGVNGIDGKDGVDGKDGKDGQNGADGQDGKDGQDGVGIEKTTMDEQGNLVITYTDGSTQTIEHEWTFAMTLREPDQSSVGLDMYVCSKCRLSRVVEKEEAHTHEYSGVITQPTCVDKGYTTYTCSCGDSYTSDYVDATGEHVYTKVETAENIIYTCSCGHSYTQEIGSNVQPIETISFGESVQGQVVKTGENEYDLYISGQGKMKGYTPNTYPLKQKEYRNQIKNVYIENGVTSVGKYAFYQCTGIEKIVLSNTVESIGKEAFSKCSSLSQIELGTGLTSIGDKAFSDTYYFMDNSKWEGNKALYINNYLIATKSPYVVGTYRVKDGTVLIADKAFYSCQNALEVVIPNSVKYIGNNVFESSCVYVITFEASRAEWNAIQKGDGWDTAMYSYKVVCADDQD